MDSSGDVRSGWAGSAEARQEAALVRAMLAGDERAMERFADEYFPALLRFCLARLPGQAELARDLVQATVCKALGKLASFRGEAPLSTWLCACCRNEIAMHFRQLRRQPPMLELDAEPGQPCELPDASPAGLPEAALLRRQQARLVHAALDELPERYSRALEWKYLERVSVEEVAARLRLTAKAAESVLSRARVAFREGYGRLAGARARLERGLGA